MGTRRSRAGAAVIAALVSFSSLVGAAGGKVNLNTATAEDLAKLPEMNEAKAKAIVNYRGSHGDFIQVDELVTIPQVKPIYPKLKDLVTAD